MNADAVLNALLADDPDREKRQLHLIDARGNIAAHTGTECIAEAGARRAGTMCPSPATC